MIGKVIAFSHSPFRKPLNFSLYQTQPRYCLTWNRKVLMVVVGIWFGWLVVDLVLALLVCFRGWGGFQVKSGATQGHVQFPRLFSMTFHESGVPWGKLHIFCLSKRFSKQEIEVRRHACLLNRFRLSQIKPFDIQCVYVKRLTAQPDFHADNLRQLPPSPTRDILTPIEDFLQ